MFKFTLLTSAMALGTYYTAISAPEASPMRIEALRVMSVFAPEFSCKIDAVACLERRGDELRSIGNKVAGVILGLIEQRSKIAVELKRTEARLSANTSLLAAGRDLWERNAKSGITVRWRGVAYTAPEFKSQLQLLWDEKPLLEATVSGLRKAASEVETRIGQLGSFRTQVAGESALMSSRIAAARSGVLVGDLDRVLADVDRLAAAADGQTLQAAIPTLRSTEELDQADQKAESKVRQRNPGFDTWLGGNTNQ
jgi:hypothetical protein